MAFSFTPRDEEECIEPDLEPGPYEFTVQKAEAGYSKSSGQQMVTLTLQVWREDGTSKTIFDYLMVESDKRPCFAKVRNFAVSVNMLDAYQTGTMEAGDLEGKAGRVKIKMGKPSDDFPAKNEVADYLPPEARVGAFQPATTTVRPSSLSSDPSNVSRRPSDGLDMEPMNGGPVAIQNDAIGALPGRTLIEAEDPFNL